MQKPTMRNSLKNGAGYVETYPNVPASVLEVLLERGAEGANVMAIAGDANLLSVETAEIVLEDLFRAGFVTKYEDKEHSQRNRYIIREDMWELIGFLARKFRTAAKKPNKS